MDTKLISKGLNKNGEYVFIYEVDDNGKKSKLGIKVDRLNGETDEEYLSRVFKDNI
jgi:hypothetical protein